MTPETTVRTPRPSCRGCGRTPGSRRRAEDFRSFEATNRTYWCGRCPNPDTQVELHCRYCPTISQRLLCDAAELASFDPLQKTYLCSNCRQVERQVKPVRLYCRRCGKKPNRPVLPERLKHLRTFKRDEGKPTYLCKKCAGRENARKMRGHLVATYGVTPSDSEETHRAAMAAHVERYMRPRAGSAALRSARVARQERGLSDKARTKVSLGHFVKEHRAGEWRLCPICRKVHYLSPQEAAEGGPGMHNSCYRQFAHSDEYREWRRQVGSMRSPHFRLLLKRFPFPVPAAPRGRAANSEQLDRFFCWTLRYFAFGESWRQIGKSDSYSHVAVRQGVLTFIRHLPDTWREIFPDPRQGQRLETSLPVSQLRTAIEI